MLRSRSLRLTASSTAFALREFQSFASPSLSKKVLLVFIIFHLRVARIQIFFRNPAPSFRTVTCVPARPSAFCLPKYILHPSRVALRVPPLPETSYRSQIHCKSQFRCTIRCLGDKRNFAAVSCPTHRRFRTVLGCILRRGTTTLMHISVLGSKKL